VFEVLLAAGISTGGVIAVQHLPEGMTLMLYDIPCEFGGWRQNYTLSHSGRILNSGCWTVLGDYVLMTWRDGEGIVEKETAFSWRPQGNRWTDHRIGWPQNPDD
jgi:hypothetical protein